MSRNSPIDRAPGAWLRRLAKLCFSRAVYLSVFEPILDEMCAGHCEALATGDGVAARFALLRGWGMFWVTVIELPVSWIKKLIF